MKSIDVALCENTDTGDPSGTAWRIQFYVKGEVCLSFEAMDFISGVKMLTNDRIIEYRKIRVKHNGRSMWVGNIKWNEYRLPIDYGLGLMNLIAGSRNDWTFDTGWSDLYTKIKDGSILTAKDLGFRQDVQPLVVNTNQLKLFSPNPYL